VVWQEVRRLILCLLRNSIPSIQRGEAGVWPIFDSGAVAQYGHYAAPLLSLQLARCFYKGEWAEFFNGSTEADNLLDE
jgi:hypothetical protein